MPMYDLKTLENQLDETLRHVRQLASLSAVFAVARRTREIGLRMALGAPRSGVLWLVMREVLILLGGGLIAGVPGAYMLSRYVASQLFGVTPADVSTGAASIAVLGLAALVSGLVPARRASAIDP